MCNDLAKAMKALCENKAVAILAEVQAGRPTIIHKDGGEMLIAIVLDRPLHSNRTWDAQREKGMS